MRKPFTLEEYKVHPDWKVETRNGKPARILCYDRQSISEIKHPIIALVGPDSEIPYDYTVNGECWGEDKGRMRPNLDLFLVTPEEELTEFEKAVLTLCEDMFQGPVGKDDAKKRAKDLLELAEKELASRYKTSSDLNGFAYEKGYEDGKAEALKDLPRWVRHGWNKYDYHFAMSPNSKDRVLVKGHYYILLSDLEKLPKEE